MKKEIRVFTVPTGKIMTVEGDKKMPLEFLVIGDYGKEHNIKADFLNLTDEIGAVPNGEAQPMEEKMVVTVSTQYGCSMGCKFCQVPKVGPGINTTLYDLQMQVLTALQMYPNVKETRRLNVHYARMGEPTFNQNVLDAAIKLKGDVFDRLNGSHVHPVVSTMMPRKNKHLLSFLLDWTNVVKNDYYDGEAGLQFSINSTNEGQRRAMFSGNSMPIKEISSMCGILPKPKGRKYTLNFAVADGFEINAKYLRRLFDPAVFMVKLTPIHNTEACYENKLTTTLGYSSFYPYQKIERELKEVGFDVLVFIASTDEDESLITCGNLILSGSRPRTEFKETVMYKSKVKIPI